MPIWMRIPIAMLPEAIMEHYQLHTLIHKGHVYMEIQCSMHSLPQASLLANWQLQQFFAPHGYIPCAITPSLWWHHMHPIAFAFVEDDFAVKYTN